MSVIEPRPDPETVAALLDTAWRTAASESQRTDSLDRKMATLATFSLNEIKLRRVRLAFLLLVAGVALVALGGITLMAWTAIA